MKRQTMKWWATTSLGLRLSLGYLLFLTIIAILAPVLTDTARMVPFGPNALPDTPASFKPPGYSSTEGHVHYLGTDGMGRDVASRMIWGARTAFLVGAGSSILSFLIALLLGVVSGYFGNDRARANVFQILVFFAGLVLLVFYWIEYHRAAFIIPFIMVSIFLFTMLLGLMGRINSKSIRLPVDGVIMKGIEIFDTIPGLFIVLSLFAIISRPSIINVILIIGLISWPMKTRILRAEIMKAMQSNYIKSAHILGLTTWKMIRSHLLPNTISPLLVALAFSFTSAILLESTLSFLNIGLPQDVPSWGGIMRDARDYFSAWWLAVFPGLAIFLTILSLNVVVDSINKR